MNVIQTLDDALINKIAAGEVVERPASIVKELVENSIDAGATKISVELTEGGRQRIIISDNGSGMTADDAKLSIVRHATSKIRTTEDLFNLNTMGFRGEALASISSICKFTLMTCRHKSPEGVRLYTEGGSDIAITPWQSEGGTTIICDEIFYNVPVRQKFLKSSGTEYSAIYELLQALALSHPNIDFTLVHNGRETLRAPLIKKVESREQQIRQRFLQVMKGDGALALIYQSSVGPYAQIEALISAPGIEKPTAKDMFLFVNGRFVRDKSLRFSVLRGYHSHLLKGKYPVCAIFITMDPGLVDANVHPAKTEVRLQYSHDIHDQLASAIREGLRSGAWSSTISLSSKGSHPSIQTEGEDRASQRDVARPASVFSEDRFSLTPGRLESRGSSFTSKPAVWRDVTPEFFPDNQGTHTPESSRALFAEEPVKPLVQNFVPWSELCYMGSIADCYLIFSHGNRRSGARLLAVDQHAFHERILYEKLCKDSSLLKSSQPLLVPEVLVMGHGDVAKLKELKEQMAGCGFKYEIIDEQSVEVRAVPALLAKADLESLFVAIARHEEKAIPLEGNIGLAHDLLATMACHGAVRAGESLGAEELKTLIRQASEVDFYHNCPHGRRVFRWWDEAQIAQWFNR